MFRYHFPFKFYLGVIFIIASLIVGALTKITFIFYFSDDIIRWASIIVYFLSWPFLIIGGWWVGKEYYQLIKKYVSYKFYQESVRQGTRRVYRRTKERWKRRRKTKQKNL